MEKGTNAAVFPERRALVNALEYNWWTDPGRVEKLPEGRRAAASASPTFSRPGRIGRSSKMRPRSHRAFASSTAPGHTPGHSAFLVTSGSDQLMVSNDTMYVPALLAPHPDWQGATIRTGRCAIASRRKLIDRVIADKMMICGAHFPFPGTGTFAKDGDAYGSRRAQS